MCDYNCSSSGGCEVRYTGPPRSGSVKGSCFPQAFGGSCSGTPPECRDCNEEVDCVDDNIQPPTFTTSEEDDETPGEQLGKHY